ncbi:phosphate acyltransferase PlsX [Motiliproteus sp.]|uniref:phosphate acyltransferase PlsX n=1 Tax=Motiliproteus sp. TaxID=1898955 RepID=UPI003BA86456
MVTRCTLAVDVMSGDLGPRVAVPAVCRFAEQHPDTELLLIGDPSRINPLLTQSTPRVSVLAAESVVEMTDKPSFALRKRKDSSMYLAVQLVAEGKADACVSAGNTGALMAMGHYLLHMHPGIDRPAIATAIPTQNGHCYMLDLGANVDCSAEHLFQFALMGSALSEAVDQLEQPRVSLLNVGQEEIKGNEQVKLASRLIREHSSLNYIGYIEGNDIYSGKADVVVCDGFVGNVALKSSEGLARFITRELLQSFDAGWYQRLVGLLARPLLERLKRQLDPSRRNGASLLGLQGIVVKSHGSANEECFGHAIAQARAEVIRDVPGLINEKLSRML